jgi:hypothetical protein
MARGEGRGEGRGGRQTMAIYRQYLTVDDGDTGTFGTSNTPLLSFLSFC